MSNALSEEKKNQRPTIRSEKPANAREIWTQLRAGEPPRLSEHVDCHALVN